MELTFNWKQIKNRGIGLTFDDVLLVPAKSEIKSRREPDLTSKFTKKLQLETPIISANMDTVTEAEMATAMGQLGAVGILHRFVTIEEQVKMVTRVRENAQQFKSEPILAASIGVNEDFKERTKALLNAGVNCLTIDIAHGHSTTMMDVMKWIKDTEPDIQLVAGNISTPEATHDLIQAGADAVKVGIGPGSMCTTRIITGCGVPQLTAIAICSEVAREYQVPVIADGGIRNSGDIVKCFAAGASTVMLGSMLSGTIETPGEIKQGRKQYRGMASKSAQVSWRGGVPEGMAPEGESTFVSVKGHVKDVVLELTGGIRSGMSYLNAVKFDEIIERARFMQLSANGVRENHAHGLKN